jgi:hypothetical protein
MAVERSLTGNHRDGARRGGKPAPFSHAEQQPADGEHAHTRRKGVARARERPEQHDREKACARADNVHELSTAGVHHSVGDEERRLEERELLVRDGNVPLDRLDRDRQRLAIEIADGNRHAHEDGDTPAQHHHSKGSITIQGRAAILPAAAARP